MVIVVLGVLPLVLTHVRARCFCSLSYHTPKIVRRPVYTLVGSLAWRPPASPKSVPGLAPNALLFPLCPTSTGMGKRRGGMAKRGLPGLLAVSPIIAAEVMCDVRRGWTEIESCRQRGGGGGQASAEDRKGEEVCFLRAAPTHARKGERIYRGSALLFRESQIVLGALLGFFFFLPARLFPTAGCVSGAKSDGGGGADCQSRGIFVHIFFCPRLSPCDIFGDIFGAFLQRSVIFLCVYNPHIISLADCLSSPCFSEKRHLDLPVSLFPVTYSSTRVCLFYGKREPIPPLALCLGNAKRSPGGWLITFWDLAYRVVPWATRSG